MRIYFNFILMMSIFFIRLFSFETNCPLCMESLYDYDSEDDFYKESLNSIIYSFNDCLEELKIKKTTVPGGPSNSMVIDYSTVEGEEEYRKKAFIDWFHSLIDTGRSESDIYRFSYKKFNYSNVDEFSSIEKEFNFLNYSDVLHAFSVIYDDLSFIYFSEDELNKTLITEKRHYIEWVKERTYISYSDPYFGISNEALYRGFLKDIKRLEDNIKEAEVIYQNNLIKSSEYQGKIEKIYENIFDWCIHHHGWIGSYYQRGLLNFNNGNVFEALNDIQQIIEKSDNFDELESQIFLLKGQSELELGLYHDAIITLSEAVKKDSKNKDLYIDRAQAYFELGKFDLAIKDYVLSDLKITPIDEKNISSLDFSKGLILGIIKGGKDGSIEFVPSALASLHGLGHGLWAFTSKPIECSKEMISACENCMKYVIENTSIDLIKELVPEIKTLISDWNIINDEQKGELIGHAIGKYGIDILTTGGSAKAIKCYRDLKKANAILTLEKSAKSFKNSEIILKEATQRYAQREAILKRANLKIQWDKQGKHIKNHINYIEGKSILTHKDPQKLIDNFAGKGIKVRGDIPGSPGFQEVVNFEELIGFYCNKETKEEIATTWGKIHYAQDGTHIVPCLPKK